MIQKYLDDQPIKKRCTLKRASRLVQIQIQQIIVKLVTTNHSFGNTSHLSMNIDLRIIAH